MATGDDTLREGLRGETPSWAGSLDEAKEWVRSTLRKAVIEDQFMDEEALIEMLVDLRYRSDRETVRDTADDLSSYRDRLTALKQYHKQRIEHIDGELERLDEGGA